MGAGRSMGRHPNCGKIAALFGVLACPALAEHFPGIGGENASARAGMVAVVPAGQTRRERGPNREAAFSDRPG
jgi:hypothetical protein